MKLQSLLDGRCDGRFETDRPKGGQQRLLRSKASQQHKAPSSLMTGTETGLSGVGCQSDLGVLFLYYKEEQQQQG